LEKKGKILLRAGDPAFGDQGFSWRAKENLSQEETAKLFFELIGDAKKGRIEKYRKEYRVNSSFYHNRRIDLEELIENIKNEPINVLYQKLGDENYQETHYLEKGELNNLFDYPELNHFSLGLKYVKIYLTGYGKEWKDSKKHLVFSTDGQKSTKDLLFKIHQQTTGEDLENILSSFGAENRNLMLGDK
jgi:hypothetical protein